MKIKLFILGLSLGISILSGCNDDLTQVGTGIQPENDRPLVYADTFYMKAKTLQTEFCLCPDNLRFIRGNIRSFVRKPEV